jgi:Mrp family chromosome partitioning ATPase
MSALDRAIIKAYHGPKSRAGAVAEPPAPHIALGPAVPLTQALSDLSAMSAATATIVRSPIATAPPVVAEPASAPVGPSIAAMMDKALLPDFAAAKPFEPSALRTATAPPSAFATAAIEVAPAQEEPAWRPLLQVDRVVWPAIHGRLQSTAAAAVDRLSEGLASICASGSKVLGMASCESGEGVTTLLLAAARKLLSRGLKVALVDANGNNPHLAQDLGLLPQIGWEETLSGGLPLEEVVIESLADGLAILPTLEAPAATIGKTQIEASFNILEREFDLVLVDLGPLGGIDGKPSQSDAAGGEDSFAQSVAEQTDAVVLVQNVRVTTPNRLAEARERLAATNLRHAGTIQNFVAG